MISEAKTFRFSDVFRGYRKATSGCNGLMLEAKFGDDPKHWRRYCLKQEKPLNTVFSSFLVLGGIPVDFLYTFTMGSD